MSNTVLGMRHLAITQLRTSWFTILKTQDIRGFHFYTHDLQFLHCALEWCETTHGITTDEVVEMLHGISN